MRRTIICLILLTPISCKVIKTDYSSATFIFICATGSRNAPIDTSGASSAPITDTSSWDELLKTKITPTPPVKEVYVRPNGRPGVSHW